MSAVTGGVADTAGTHRLRTNSLFWRVAGSWSGRVGIGLVTFVVALAIIGPWVSPHSPTSVIDVPFATPSAGEWLGSDQLGRDVLSRLLHGGRVLLMVSCLATLLAYVVGISIGMASGYRRGAFDLVTVGAADLLVSFPPIVFVLVLIAATGPKLSIIVAGIAAVHVPRIVRIVRAVTIDLSGREFIEAAVARGEPVSAILGRDVLPNILTPVLADFGLRLTGSVILYSSLSYLGLGLAPPAADWGLMISENRVGLTIQPWAVLAPAAMIGILTVGVNLVADSVARSVGRSVTDRGV